MASQLDMNTGGQEGNKCRKREDMVIRHRGKGNRCLDSELRESESALVFVHQLLYTRQKVPLYKSPVGHYKLHLTDEETGVHRAKQFVQW